MDIETFVTPGLGDTSFLVASGDEAALVDPQRDAWRFVRAAEERGWSIRYVAETHVHNDYVSGALEVREATGAELLAPAAGGYEFPVRPFAEGDEITFGDLRFVALETPGHTFEHLSWAAYEGDAEKPEAVFTGGSLLVGSAGRSDLLGMDLAEELARAQYRSVRRLAQLGDQVQVFPTHGAGSFCVSLLPKAERCSTLGAERATNAALLAPDEDTFVREQLGLLMRFPAYYPRMAPINRRGPAVLGSVPVAPQMEVDSVEAAVASGALIVDGRDRNEFAAEHIPRSLNIELNESFGSYVGWIVPFDTPLVLVLPDPVGDAAAEALTQLLRIGWDGVNGYLGGGVEAWRAAGRPTRSYPLGTTRELRERLATGAEVRVLDVRQPGEWIDGIVPGSRLEFVADLAGRMDALPRDEELWVLCTNGHRAAIAASLLDGEGVPVRLVARSGILGVEDYLVSPATIGVRGAGVRAS